MTVAVTTPLAETCRNRRRLKAYRTGSGYYIDVGCSQLIIDGEIKVKSGVDIERLTEGGIRFVDGTEIDTDVVIQAIGFQSLHEVIAQIVSREVGDRIGRCWGRATTPVPGTANRATCTNLSRTRICGFKAAISHFRGFSPSL